MSTNRILKMTAGGSVEFYEPSGPSKVSLTAPALAADVPITLPATLPGAGQTLPVVVDDTGLMSYGGALGASVSLPLLGGTMQGAIDMGGFAITNLPAGVGNSAARQTELDATQAEVDALEVVVAGMSSSQTMQQTYGFGEDITLTTGKTITWTQPLNEALLVLDKTGTGAGVTCTITDAGSGHSVSITKSGPGGRSILVTHSSTSTAVEVTQSADASALIVSKGGTGAGNAVSISNAGTGIGFALTQSGNAVGLHVNKTGTGSGNAVEITNAGNGYGLNITNGSASNNGILLTSSGTAIGLKSTNSAGSAGTFNYTGAGSFTVLFVENLGTGLTIATNSGGSMATTGAKLTNAGVWTDGTCFSDTKADITPVADESGWLDNLDKLQLVRWVGEKAPLESPVLSPLQDELVTFFGFDPNRGVAGREIATVGLVCLRALHERFKAAVLRIDALEGKA